MTDWERVSEKADSKGKKNVEYFAFPPSRPLLTDNQFGTMKLR
jgi:hypothetical protein